MNVLWRRGGLVYREGMIILLCILEADMASTERVTVTLSAELVRGIDRFERNRSRFIAEAVDNELVRRRREGLLHSLKNPHSEVAELADAGLAEWGASLPAGDDDLVDVKAGMPVHWVAGEGWVEESA
jgi:hypothetical protein